MCLQSLRPPARSQDFAAKPKRHDPDRRAFQISFEGIFEMARSRRLVRAALVGLAIAAISFTVAKPASAKPPQGATEEMVAMRDGVKLATSIYLPKGEGPFPVVLTRTPYGKDGELSAMGSTRYPKAGYVYVVQDCRGKFKSEGEYKTFENDRDDGHDTINWIAKQPWCNGKVGMSGASAMGITSLLAAISQPEALKCAYVIVAPESFLTEATFIGGVFKEADTTGWLTGQGVAAEIPLRRASLAKPTAVNEQDIVLHRDKIKIPIYHVGGWYDIFSVGTQGNFAFLQHKGPEGARGKQKLMMGPFGHGGLKGELKYDGGGGILSALGDELRWFDHHLKGADNGIATEPAVTYYQMASARKKAFSPKNGWKKAETWPIASRPTNFYLHPDRTLSTDGPTVSDSSTSYDFDPKNPVKTVAAV